MPKTFIKDSTGVQRQVQSIYVKTAGIGATGATGSVSPGWVPIRRVFVKNVDTSWSQVFGVPGTITYTAPATTFTALGQTQTYTTPGSYAFTVPTTVISLSVTMIGAGGNGNANEGQSNPGPGGGSGAYFVNYPVTVTPGQAISFSVGAPGAKFIPSNDGGQTCGGDTTFGSLVAGGGLGGHWRSGPIGDEAGGEGGTASAGGTNGTAGNPGSKYGGNGYGANSPAPFNGVGGVGYYGSGYGGNVHNGGAASGYGAGGGGGSNNAGGGSGSGGYLQVSYNYNAIAPALPAQTFTVPAGVYNLNVTLIGGGGGAGGNYYAGGTTINGGLAGTAGQVVSGTLAVVPGDVYTVYVGGNGMAGSNSWDGYSFSYQGINALNSVTYNGTASSIIAGTNCRGGSAGAATVLMKGSTVIAVAAGGAGGNSGIITGTTRSIGGAISSANVVPVGWTATTGTNGGVASNVTASYSGSYSNGAGITPIQTIQTALTTSPYNILTSTVPTAVGGSSPDYSFSNVTLSPGVVLIANGTGQAGIRFNATTVTTSGITLSNGGFSVGRTVSGINFNTGATQGNGGQAFYFYTGVTNNPGAPGSATLTY